MQQDVGPPQQERQFVAAVGEEPGQYLLRRGVIVLLQQSLSLLEDLLGRKVRPLLALPGFSGTLFPVAFQFLLSSVQSCCRLDPLDCLA
jgi:hypothetical protein